MKIFLLAVMALMAVRGEDAVGAQMDKNKAEEKVELFRGFVEVVEGVNYEFRLINLSDSPIVLKFDAFADRGNGLAPAGVSLELEISESSVNQFPCNEGLRKIFGSKNLQMSSSRTVRYSSAILGSGRFSFDNSFLLSIGARSTFESPMLSLSSLFVGIEDMPCFSRYRVLYETNINGDLNIFKSRWISIGALNGD